MTFVGAYTNNSGLTILDGYSKAKTIKGALKDLSREVAKISESESHFTDYMEDTLAIINASHGNEWFIECQQVGSASRIVEDEDGNFLDMEYAEGNFYLCIGFVA